MCESRIFFVEQKDQLILCGLHRVSEKFDKIGPHTTHYSQICDYLLYSENAGFFFVYGCSSPIYDSLNNKNTSPAIYYQTSENEPYSALEYGKNFDSRTILNLQIKYNVRKYDHNGKVRYYVAALINTNISYEIKKATVYCELPLVPDWFVYTTSANYEHWKIPARLINYIENIQYPLLHQEYSLDFNYNTTLSLAVLSRDIKQLRIADKDYYYFYVLKSDSPAFDMVIRYANMVGKVNKIDNLLKYDSSVNYQLAIPKSTSPNIVSFLFGVISKSKTISGPTILGCSVYEIIQYLLGRYNGIATAITSGLDESLNNVINLIFMNFSELPKWKIINHIKTCYGSCASNLPIYWYYYHGEGLRCDDFPTLVGSTTGIETDDYYEKSLDDTGISVKWISEYSLFQLVFLYYPDAVMHYNVQWLGQQHLDIYIPCLRLGIEYQGQQHYEPTAFFGGKLGFKKRKLLDDRKRNLCREHGVTLIEWSYKTQINAANLISTILQNCNTIIPIPDPSRRPPIVDDSVLEEKTAISIRKYDLEGHFLCSYDRIKDASETSGISYKAIMKALSGYSKQAGGYQWRREVYDAPKDDIDALNTVPTTGVSKPVYQVSLDGEVIAEYPSISKAAKAIGINSKSISCVLNGTQKTAGNYYWVYKESE